VVVYDPNHPSTVEEKSSLTGPWWISLVIFLLLGVLFGWLGVWLWRKASRLHEEPLPWEGSMTGADL
jgi:hypothetical protein